MQVSAKTGDGLSDMIQSLITEIETRMEAPAARPSHPGKESETVLLKASVHSTLADEERRRKLKKCAC
jgi:hypothetical protein